MELPSPSAENSFTIESTLRGKKSSDKISSSTFSGEIIRQKWQFLMHNIALCHHHHHSPPWWSNIQTEPSSSPENVPETSSAVQIVHSQDSSGGTQPPTPRTPTTPLDHEILPNPPTPGTTNSGNLGVPSSYVVSEGTNGSNRSYASLTPVNPAAAVDSDSVNDEVDSSYVTYVDEGADHSSLYAAAVAAAAASSTSSQNLPYPVYAVGENTMYTSSTAQYYPNNSSGGGIAYSQIECKTLQQTTGVTYLVSPTNNNTASMGSSNLEIDGQTSLSHATRVSPATVQWLVDNYETAEGVSLPRSTLYNHYIRHCTEHKLDPVNAASFGKLIRSVFLGLRTRRLGTRGNSKYHYYGIRLKPESMLNHFVEPPSHHVNGGGGRHSSNGMNSGHMPKRIKMSKSENFDSSAHNNGLSIGEAVMIQQYLGDSSRALEDFPSLEFSIKLPDGISQDDLLIFRSIYREHCEILLEDIVNFQLSDVDRRWRDFWRTGDSSPNNVEHSEFENILPQAKLQIMCRVKEIQQFIRDSDFQFYQSIVGILMPDVLRPIPSSMTQAIRNFAKTLEGCLAGALHGYPEEMVSLKLSVVNALAQTLRRYTSLNHLAQAARAVLQNQAQINQMLSDLNRVDFHNVEEQASWVCGCDGDLVPGLEVDFKATLSRQQTLEQWAIWLESVVDRVLRPHLSSQKFVQTARHFILKWSFYSSLVIRDLTLRSAASFGSFHLLRLLYDEYMFFLVEHRVAQVTGTVPIAVLGKKSFDCGPFDSSLDSADEEDGQNESSTASHYTNEHHQSSINGTLVQSAEMNGILGTTQTIEVESTSSNNGDDPGSGPPSQSIIKSEFKQRVKVFLTV